MMDLVIEEKLLEFGFFVNDAGGAFHSIVLIVWLSTSFELFHHSYYSPDFFYGGCTFSVVCLNEFYDF